MQFDLNKEEEGKFCRHYINYIFYHEDHDHLFDVIHERVELDQASKAIIPHLWSYRARITLEHLLQVLQPQKDNCPLLHEFLIQVM